MCPLPPSDPSAPAGREAARSTRPVASRPLGTPLLAGLLLLLALGVYYGRLDAPLTSDARFLTYENAHVLAPDGIARFWTEDYFKGALTALPYTSGYYRPVVNALFWLEYRWAGRRDLFYNLSEVLLHALNALLVALLVGAVARDRRVGALAGVLFVVHPVHAFAATEPAARADVLFASFYLGALLLFARALDREGNDVPWAALAGVTLLTLLSVLSKEMGITLPAALMLLVGLRNAQQQTPLRRLAWTAPVWAASGLYLVWRFVVLEVGTQSMGYAQAHSPALLLLAQLKTIPIHLSRIVLPLWPSYPELNPLLIGFVEGTLTDPITYIALALVAALVTGALLWKQNPPLAFWTSLFLVSLSPLLRTDSIGGTVEINVILAQERWIYLPSVAVLALIAHGIFHLHGRMAERRVPRLDLGFAGAAILIIPLLGWSASLHAGRHEDPFALLRSLYLIPEQHLGRMQEANRLILYANLVAIPLGDSLEAERRARQADELVPDSPLMALNVARVLASRGKWEEVRATLDPWLAPSLARLRALHDTNFRVYDDLNRVAPELPLLLARAQARLGNYAEAERLLCEAQRRRADPSRIQSGRDEVRALAANASSSVPPELSGACVPA